MGRLGIGASYWKGRHVFLTGHTGFKGSWLSLWLHRLGAVVTGYSLEPPTEPSLFQVAGVGQTLAADYRADIRNLERLREAMLEHKPEVIFHMAAQSLVRDGYRDPVETYSTNVLGTVIVLEAARALPNLSAVISVTTDKCYENREWVHPYRENDTLGGADPYSSSKACAELVTAAYRSSYFSELPSTVGVASVRAGNVIGGGDWARDRLVPDCIRSFATDQPVQLRHPQSLRPWQHVLEPLAGYLALAERLSQPKSNELAMGWNFGPDPTSEATVLEVARLAARTWGGNATVSVCDEVEPEFKEARLLRLDSTKARDELLWRPQWSLGRAVEETTRWYKAWNEKADMLAYSLKQIDDYSESLK